ncbi:MULTISPECIES: ACP S-malonyltransferase [unclassified Thalassotalea]|uniref:ACP S-malonyltransferase n=1 Tax=unclassified Thalassotalea TaxID=2614972 RepID=UPI00108044D1|nr:MULTISPECIES: ACP S-malonyltransferase [unclassified Thalassotalea]NMP15563.1 ACP S-malonyltransferase [Thalassotalea sp. Y01]QBY05792.1 ACP S-malonyltransferase [Thalassotalea sp. HSM 43]
MNNQLAFVFPGQGSQAVGMLADLGDNDVVKQTFAEASEALGYDLWDLIQNDSDGKLNQTDYTQPALLASSVAVFRAWLAANGDNPAVLAGHSLGEYSALVCAGVLSLSDGVKLVEKRGQYMQQAVPAGVGAMYAIIGLDDATIIDCCAQAAQGQVVSAVNFNSPGQVVIAGNKDAVERAGALCKEAGAKRALPLPVSVPSHCALMQPAADQLAADFDNISFNAPQIPVINNVDVATVDDAAAIKDALIRQLYSPVRWTESIEKIAGMGVENVIEMGPGKVLSGLVKRINKQLSCVSVNTADTLTSALEG